jgi:hypothetical protein
MPVRQRLRAIIESVRLRTNESSPEDKAEPMTLTHEERDALDKLLRLSRGEIPVMASRKPTNDDVVEAAWGNLNVEEPDVSIQDARRIILKAT